jgi:hypothetical protein
MSSAPIQQADDEVGTTTPEDSGIVSDPTSPQKRWSVTARDGRMMGAGSEQIIAILRKQERRGVSAGALRSCKISVEGARA